MTQFLKSILFVSRPSSRVPRSNRARRARFGARRVRGRGHALLGSRPASDVPRRGICILHEHAIWFMRLEKRSRQVPKYFPNYVWSIRKVHLEPKSVPYRLSLIYHTECRYFTMDFSLNYCLNSGSGSDSGSRLCLRERWSRRERDSSERRRYSHTRARRHPGKNQSFLQQLSNS